MLDLFGSHYETDKLGQVSGARRSTVCNFMVYEFLTQNLGYQTIECDQYKITNQTLGKMFLKANFGGYK